MNNYISRALWTGLIALSASTSALAQASDFPSKPVTLVTPSSHRA